MTYTTVEQFFFDISHVFRKLSFFWSLFFRFLFFFAFLLYIAAFVFHYKCNRHVTQIFPVLLRNGIRKKPKRPCRRYDAVCLFYYKEMQWRKIRASGTVMPRVPLFEVLLKIENTLFSIPLSPGPLVDSEPWRCDPPPSHQVCSLSMLSYNALLFLLLFWYLYICLQSPIFRETMDPLYCLGFISFPYCKLLMYPTWTFYYCM